MLEVRGCFGVSYADIEAKIREKFGDEFARHECDVAARGEFSQHPTGRRNLVAYRIEGVQDGVATFRIGRERFGLDGTFAHHVLGGKGAVVALVRPPREPIVMVAEGLGKLVWDASPAQVQLTYWTTEVL